MQILKKKAIFFHAITKAFVALGVVDIQYIMWKSTELVSPYQGTMSKDSWQKNTPVADEATNSKTFHPTKLGVKIRAER